MWMHPDGDVGIWTVGSLRSYCELLNEKLVLEAAEWRPSLREPPGCLPAGADTGHLTPPGRLV